MDECGSQHAPFTEQSFREAIERTLGPRRKVPGFTAYGDVLRESQRRKLFIADVGRIPEGEVFEYRKPCAVLHPGLCKTRKPATTALCKFIAKSLHKSTADFSCGTFVNLLLVLPENRCVESWFMLGYRRGS
eukprot:3350151-Pyramimonas_sp.AAC.1